MHKSNVYNHPVSKLRVRSSVSPGFHKAIVGLLLLVFVTVCPQTARSQTFNDVPTDYWAYNFIEILSNSGITSGCGGGNYCPNAEVTRDQMAVFLVRTFGL